MDTTTLPGWEAERTADALEARLGEMEGKLDRALALLEDGAQAREDLAEVVGDLMPAANGMTRLAIARLDALEREGTLGALGALAEVLRRPAVLHALERAARALGATSAPVGPLGTLRALREPQVAQGMGVLVDVLRALGAGPHEPRAGHRVGAWSRRTR